MIGEENFHGMGSHLLGQLGEDADNLVPLVALQLTDAVVGLHYLGRLDEHRSARGTLIVDYARDLALQPRGHRNDQTAVAQGRCDVLLHQPLALGTVQNAVERFGNGALRAPELAADVVELGRGGVADSAMLVENLVDALHEGGKGDDAIREAVQLWIFIFGFHAPAVLVGSGNVGIFLVVVAECGDERDDRVEGTAQVEEFFLFKVGPLQADALKGRTAVEEGTQGEVVVFGEQTTVFAHLFQKHVYLFGIDREGHRLHPLLAQGREAVGAQHGPNLVKADLILKVFWIYHHLQINMQRYCQFRKPPNFLSSIMPPKAECIAQDAACFRISPKKE